MHIVQALCAGKRMVGNPKSRTAHGGAAAAVSLTAASGGTDLDTVDVHHTLGDAWLDRRGRARAPDPSSLHGREARITLGPVHVFKWLPQCNLRDCISVLPAWHQPSTCGTQRICGFCLWGLRARQLCRAGAPCWAPGSEHWGQVM